jgi:hypothetical protein
MDGSVQPSAHVLRSFSLSWVDFCLHPLKLLSALPYSIDGFSHHVVSCTSSLLTSFRLPTFSESYTSLANIPLYIQLNLESNLGLNLGNTLLDSTYSTTSLNLSSVSENSTSALQEDSSDQRFVRFMNPVFQYDFKVGNYMPDEAKKMNPHLFNTIKDVTTGIRKSS